VDRVTSADSLASASRTDPPTPLRDARPRARRRLARASAALTLVATALAPAAAVATRISVETAVCDGADFGLVAPAGLAYNSGIDRFIVVDSTRNRASIVNPGCALTAAFPLAPLGIVSPSGVAFVQATGGYALVDNSQRILVLATSSGEPAGACDLLAAGVEHPEGVAYDRARGGFAVVDDADDELVVVGDGELDGGACERIQAADLAALGITAPGGIEQLAETGGFVITDISQGVAFIVDADFGPVDAFDVRSAGFGPVGIAYDAGRERFYVIDRASRELTELDARGSSETLCDTQSFGIPLPDDLAYDGATGDLFVLGEDPAEIAVVDADTCALRRRHDLEALGIDGRGIAYIPALDQVVVIDEIAARTSELAFLDDASGAVVRRCDISSLQIGAPTALAWIPDHEWLAIADAGVARYGAVDAACNAVLESSLRPVTTAAQEEVTGIDFVPTSGRWIITNWAADPPRNGGLVSIASFDATSSNVTYPHQVGLGNPNGIVALPGGSDYIVADALQHALYRWSLPLTGEPDSVSGRYRSASAHAIVALLDRGRGHVSGVARIGGDTVPVYGHVEQSEITLGADLPGGPVLMRGRVANDYSVILLGPPFGKLERTTK
jgi:DNA-binding beta-propeller fold protein YncE